MKKKVKVFLIFALALTMLGGCGNEKKYECTIELGENYVFDATKIFGVSEKEAEHYVANLTTLDTTKEGIYEVKVKNQGEEYTVTYTVKDTKEPVVVVKSNALFTKNIDIPNYEGVVEVRDGSECTLTLCKFKKLNESRVVDDKTLSYYADSLVTESTEDLLRRPDGLPNGDGIYSAVLLVEDTYHHKVAKELIVIYDTQEPMITGLDELNTKITVEDTGAEWTDNLLGQLSIIDNVDGVITPDMMKVSMLPTNEEKTAFKVEASYTDRAGNDTSLEYEITLTVKKPQQVTDNGNTSNGGSTAGNKKPNNSTQKPTGGTTNNNTGSNGGNTSNGGSGSSNGGNTGNNNTGNSGNNNTGNANNGSTNSGSGNTGNTNNNTSNNNQSGSTNSGSSDNGGTTKPPASNPGYSYEDRNGDGYADLAEYTVMNGFTVKTVDMSPVYAKWQLAMAEAGYYNVVYSEWDGGSYGMIVPHADNERVAVQKLRDYLASLGLDTKGISIDAFDVNDVAYQVVAYGSKIYELQPETPEGEWTPDYIPPGVLN